jgi:hypothetical protein
MDYWEHPREFLEGKSSNRIESVKYPKQSWRGRARCFRLFDDNLKPSDISPRQCGVRRRTLYRYYEDYKLLRAKRVLGRMIEKEQDEARKLEAQRKQAEYEAKQREQRQREYEQRQRENEQREQAQRQKEQQERERKASESTPPPEYTWPFSARR